MRMDDWFLRFKQYILISSSYVSVLQIVIMLNAESPNEKVFYGEAAG